MAENKIENLISISQEVGIDPAYAQGGGGNTSIKLDDKRMAIKASGGPLKNMSLHNGYSVVDYVGIRDYLKAPDEEEHVFTASINALVVETENRPSIETGFHALLGACVIHTHSVYANILTCSQEGQAMVEQLFPGAIWLNYATPGRELTLSIKKALDISKNNPNMIFLQNHGLITIGASTQEAMSLHEKINTTIREYFHLEPAHYAPNILDMDFVKGHILFPDQVVYTLSGSTILETRAAKETLWAYGFILDAMKKLNLTPQCIPQDKGEVLLSMESERFRQRALKDDLY